MVGFRVSGFRVQGSGFRVQGLGFRVQGAGFKVQDSGRRVWGLGFGVYGDNEEGGVALECGIEARQPEGYVHLIFRLVFRWLVFRW